jgi:DNA-binding transcriptional LysR family regulator
MRLMSTMHAMDIRALDLNLLHVFAAVHAARSVSRAAEALGLSQPAVSHALTRLRAALRDPLFVRAPGGVRPTPQADRLAQPVQAALQQIGAALAEADRFDAPRSRRRFVVHMSDIGAGEFLPLLMRDIAREAPATRVQAVQLAPDAIAPALDDGRLDLAFGYLPALAGLESAPLLQERYVVLLRRGHPLARRLHERAALRELEFVLVASHAEPARALHLLGLEDRIRLTLPHFTVAPGIVAVTDLAVIMPRRPALRFAAQHALQVVQAELSLPPFTVSMYWTWRQAHDPGHRWLRERALAMQLPALPTPPARAPSRRAAATARTAARSGR